MVVRVPLAHRTKGAARGEPLVDTRQVELCSSVKWCE